MVPSKLLSTVETINDLQITLKPVMMYEFDKFRLDPSERLLLRDNKQVALTGKVFDILTVLVKNSGHLLERDELMKTIWPDTAVEEGNLTRYVSTLRKALGENGQHQYIETVPRRGYRFIADVSAVEAEEGNSASRKQTRPQVTSLAGVLLASAVFELQALADGEKQSPAHKNIESKMPATRRSVRFILTLSFRDPLEENSNTFSIVLEGGGVILRPTEDIMIEDGKGCEKGFRRLPR